MMKVRQYQAGEERILWSLFYNTIHTVNARDYSQAQLDAWGYAELDEAIWQQKMESINPAVVLIDDKIVAYSDLQESGYIDHFFCHADYQRQGVGSFLMAHLEQLARAKGITKMSSDVSITARPFFEAKGFVVNEEQFVEIRGQILRNFKVVRKLV